MKRRVVVTGIGIAAPLGLGREAFWNALLNGKSGIRTITAFDPAGFPCTMAGQVPEYRVAEYVPKSYRKATKLMARDIELAVISASLAFEDVGLSSRATAEHPSWDSRRFGCNIGAGLISVDLDELTTAMIAAERDGQLDLRLWGSTAMNGLTPLWLLKYLPNMLACHVTIIHGLEGPSNTIACGEASGHLAIGEAFRTIQRGQADLMICGGAESKVHPMGMMRQTLLGRLAPTDIAGPGGIVKPFNPESTGTINSEGGGLLILEEHGHALSRGARIYAEITGFGAGQDVHGLAGEGASSTGYRGAIRRALADAALMQAEIDLLIPSGSGVQAEDAAELAVLNEVFGAHAKSTAVSLLKPQLGSLAAGTSVEAATAVLSISNRMIPPALNSLSNSLNFDICNIPRERDIRSAMSTAYSTGGQSAALIFRRF